MGRLPGRAGGYREIESDSPLTRPPAKRSATSARVGGSLLLPHDRQHGGVHVRAMAAAETVAAGNAHWRARTHRRNSADFHLKPVCGACSLMDSAKSVRGRGLPVGHTLRCSLIHDVVSSAQRAEIDHQLGISEALKFHRGYYVITSLRSMCLGCFSWQAAFCFSGGGWAGPPASAIVRRTGM